MYAQSLHYKHYKPSLQYLGENNKSKKGVLLLFFPFGLLLCTKYNALVKERCPVTFFPFGLLCIKVIPLKLFYYQTFFETWRNEHS